MREYGIYVTEFLHFDTHWRVIECAIVSSMNEWMNEWMNKLLSISYHVNITQDLMQFNFVDTQSYSQFLKKL